ncbi:similar to pectate lyase [Plenodomus lingam JN3]|uniref:Pectate lyase n=1 Tax=Leptosphaeria maculans (strain JN3 / isolate v23.1.3 / race Av1-4-5-6-7-8) TaxID=985895 RepID=E4ZMV4_LEPMJ|nr:similar to pectate lyase [Plenodomus lingam JN3]CBX92557.1 similar to pectate lyase [Plenodomus lingam JN3]
MKVSVAASILAFAATTMAGPSAVSPRNFFSMTRRSALPIPKSAGTETLKEPRRVSGTFDGGMKTYGRGVRCSGQAEGGNKDAVFLIENGGTLKNAIIGEDQIEGVHCLGSCTIENVWWAKVCEDALTIKGDGDASIIDGGATGAEDKVIQHNGAGTVTIDGFTSTDFLTLYRACGNCRKSAARHVVIKGVKAYDGERLAGINSNFGDTATIDSSTCATGVKNICQEYKGVSRGSEPESIGSGPSKACKFSNIKSC